jgi:hypothetical protein
MTTERPETQPTLEATIRAHPFASLLTAAALGFVLAQLVRRTR